MATKKDYKSLFDILEKCIEIPEELWLKQDDYGSFVCDGEENNGCSDCIEEWQEGCEHYLEVHIPIKRLDVEEFKNKLSYVFYRKIEKENSTEYMISRISQDSERKLDNIVKLVVSDPKSKVVDRKQRTLDGKENNHYIPEIGVERIFLPCYKELVFGQLEEIKEALTKQYNIHRKICETKKLETEYNNGQQKLEA